MRGRLASDCRHRSGRLDERGVVDPVTWELRLGHLGQRGCNSFSDLILGKCGVPKECSDVGFVLCEETVAELTVRREAESIAS